MRNKSRVVVIRKLIYMGFRLNNMEDSIKRKIHLVLFIVCWVLILAVPKVKLIEDPTIPVESPTSVYIIWWIYQWLKRNRYRYPLANKLYIFMNIAFAILLAKLLYGYVNEKKDED